MDPEIRLEPTEVVQMEGWLLKRKAGFDEVDEFGADSNTMDLLPTQLSPTGSKLEALLLKRTERKRYFVITTRTDPPRAMLTYCSKKPIFVKNHDDSTNLMKKAFQQEVNNSTIRGSIELNDTTGVKLLGDELSLVVPGKTYFVRPLGKGKTMAELKIEAGQWYTAIRRAIKDTWQLQMNRRSGEPSLRNSTTTDLVDCPDSLEGVLESGVHRKNFKLFCEFNHASENIAFYEKVEEYQAKFAAIQSDKKGGAKATSKRNSLTANLGRLSTKRMAKVPKDLIFLGKEIVASHVKQGGDQQVNLSDGNRVKIMDRVKKEGDKAFTADLFDSAKTEIYNLLESNFFFDFFREEQRKTGCFSQLYGKSGLRGYEVVLGHFGKVKTDLDRLLSVYQLRLDQVEDQLGVLRNALHISNDVALGSFTTTRDAMVQLFRSNALRIQAFTEFKMQLQEHVHFPLTWLKRSIELQLEQIIGKISSKIKAFEESKVSIEESKTRQQDLQVLKQLAQLDDFPSDSALEKLKLYNIEQDQIESSLEEAKQAIPVAEMACTRLTKELADLVIDSLDKLERLELHRLESQGRAIQHAVEAEKSFFETLLQESNTATAASDRMNPASDLKNYAKDFAEKLESEVL